MCLAHLRARSAHPDVHYYGISGVRLPDVALVLRVPALRPSAVPSQVCCTHVCLQVPPLARALITRSVALCPTLLVTLTMDPQSTSLDTLNQV